MFKKTLVAAALTGTLVGSAFAADVTLYGKIDEGLIYQHTSTTDFQGVKESGNTFKQNSGIDAGSRWGLKGSEELGNGYAVSFKLESGINADDGTLTKYNGNQNRLFGREASLTVSGPFGALSAGRMGGIASAAGTYDIVYAIGDALDGGGTDVLGLQGSSRYDNTLTYQSPKFAGLQATAQYSFKTDSNDAAAQVEGKSTANRYASFALTGEYGNFQGVVAYERQIRSNLNDNDDQNTFYLGGNYDFGVAKVFAMSQYFNGARSTANFDLDDYVLGNTTSGLKGYGFHLGTVVPTFGGDTTVALYYAHAKTDDFAAGEAKSKFYGAVARYEYPLSKRTTVYTGLEYGYEKVKTDDFGATSNGKSSTVDAYVGLMHNF